MNMNVINIYYRKNNTPPEVMVEIKDYQISDGVFCTLDVSGMRTLTPMDLIERIEIVEEEAEESDV